MNKPQLQLINADCLDTIPKVIDKVDAVIVDPPYGTTQCKWDSIINLDLMWKSLLSNCKPRVPYIFCAAQPFTSRLVMSKPNLYKHSWVWMKNRGSNFGVAKYQPIKEHEDIVVFGKGTVPYYPIKEPRKGSGSKRVRYLFNGSNTGKREAYGGFKDNRLNKQESEFRFPSSIQHFNVEVGWHSTQKPVELMKYLIKTYTQPGDTVLDFAMGSGTTAIAANQTKRNFIGVEKDTEIFELARRRLHETLQDKEE